ncbi:MAG: hypothetical protein OEZ01_11070, partial [Candidatus Heimdallarchaeota archaeon]|nr:hypothetical protein [Candidatus Heimdallarchaeota archaeon]
MFGNRNYRIQALRSLTHRVSKAALSLAEFKLSTSAKSLSFDYKMLTIREAATSEFNDFINSQHSIFALIADSGMGKSTFFYQFYKNKFNSPDVIPLLYDIKDIRRAGSLRKKLSEDFSIKNTNLTISLEKISKNLLSNNMRLVIMLDSINEIGASSSVDILLDMEYLARELPPNIKLSLSCRRIFWEANILNETSISRELYYRHAEFHLGSYTKKEALDSLRKYQTIYKFTHTPSLINETFIKTLQDPLLIRILSENFAGREIPEFTSQSEILSAYYDYISKKMRHKALASYLESLVEFMAKKAMNPSLSTDEFSANDIRQDGNLALIASQINDGDPLVLLEDEGIIVQSESEVSNSYRFKHDRLYEFLVGKWLIKDIKFLDSENLAQNILNLFSRVFPCHYSLTEALKSAIIAESNKNPHGHLSFYSPSLLKLLLKSGNSVLVAFVKEVLKHLALDPKIDLIELFKKIYPENDAEWQLLILDTQSDTAVSNTVLIDGLFEGRGKILERCIERLFDLCKNKFYYLRFEQLVLERTKKSNILNNNDAIALLY